MEHADRPRYQRAMPEETLATDHAGDLLARLGRPERPTTRGEHPALGWRRAGLMAVTGDAGGPGLVAPVALTAAADGALTALGALAPQAVLPACGALLLGERARLLDLTRRGAISANGSCRLVAARGGRLALSLPRSEDWELVPALLGEEAPDWRALVGIVARRDRDTLIERGRLLGLAVAADEPLAGPGADTAPFAIRRLGAGHRPGRRPIVIDLSSLWAGPLAASLLGLAGARVIKVESRRRPDGARHGDPAFHDLLNAGKASVALDFGDPAEATLLRRLIDAADIVIEASRPRALAQLGISAEAAARRGATWISITAHGREGEAANWIGYGDDAGIAGGLGAAMARGWGRSLFAGDAIADPLTGITAALAAWASWSAGGGRLVSLALSRVAAHAAALHETDDLAGWQALAQADPAALHPPRTPPSPARPLGADTAAVLAEIGVR